MSALSEMCGAWERLTDANGDTATIEHDARDGRTFLVVTLGEVEAPFALTASTAGALGARLLRVAQELRTREETGR